MVINRFIKDIDVHPLVQPDVWGVTVDLNRFNKDKYQPHGLRDIIAEWSLPFYLETTRNGNVYYDIGAYCWYVPTKRNMNPTPVHFWDFGMGEEDWEIMLRNAEFAVKTQSSGVLVKNFQTQIHLDRIMGLGEYWHWNTCWWSSLSIGYNFLRPWNTKLWLTQMILAAVTHYLYRKWICTHPLYRYRHGRFQGRGMFRIGRIARLFTWKAFLWNMRRPQKKDPWKQLAVERHCNLFISEKKVHRRLFKQRALLFIAFSYAVWRLYTYEHMCSIPVQYVPPPPYPWSEYGLATGNWLASPGYSLPWGKYAEAEIWGATRTIPRYIADNCMGYIGLAVAVAGITYVFSANAR